MCKRKKEKKSEFRTCFSRKAKGHPTYIYAKVGDKYEYIGLTHSPITRGMKNIPLDVNPNPNESEQAYIKPNVESEKVKFFEKKPKSSWKFSRKDKKKVRKIIRNSKRKKTDH